MYTTRGFKGNVLKVYADMEEVRGGGKEGVDGEEGGGEKGGGG